MSERQTQVRTDSTNHHSQLDPHSQQDSLFSEDPPTLDADMKSLTTH